jgi:hypothetical protein
MRAKQGEIRGRVVRAREIKGARGRVKARTG